MSWADDPQTITPGVGVQLRTPAGGPQLVDRVRLDNHSPYLLGLTIGTQQLWLSPWTADLYRADDSGGAVGVVPQLMPGGTPTGGTTAFITATWFGNGEPAPGVYPVHLNAQTVLAAGDQSVVLDTTTAGGGPGTVTFPLTVLPVVRSLLVLVHPVSVLAGGAPIGVDVELAAFGATTGIRYGTGSVAVYDPAAFPGAQFNAPVVLPAYGTPDPTITLSLSVQKLAGNPVPTAWNLHVLVLSLPDALIAGAFYDPLSVVPPGPASSASVLVPAGPNVVDLIPAALGRSVQLYGMSIVTTGPGGELDVKDGAGSFLYAAPGVVPLAPYNFGGYVVPVSSLPVQAVSLAGWAGGRVSLNYL